MNYIDLFVLAARKNENRAAIVDRNTSRTVTYGELDRLSSLAAGKIHAAGCGEGDFAVIWLESTMEYVAACLGILKAGCAMVPLIMQYPQERVDYIIGDCNARLSSGRISLMISTGMRSTARPREMTCPRW